MRLHAKIDGSLILEWRNTSDRSLGRFPFHPYWNALHNNLSTSARGGLHGKPDQRERDPRDSRG